jgi:hypothetical protein
VQRLKKNVLGANQPAWKYTLENFIGSSSDIHHIKP